MYINNKPLWQKEVDWSLLNSGITLPVKLNNIFGQTKNGQMLSKGEFKEIRILLAGKIYYAKITNVNFSKDKRKNDTLQLRYSRNSDIAKKLRNLYKLSYEYFLRERNKENRVNGFIRLADDKKEYVNIIGTEYKDLYYFKPIFSNDLDSYDHEKVNSMNHSIELLKDIKRFVNDIDNNPSKKDRWIKHIINFHMKWEKENVQMVIGKKYIWGNLVLIDSNKKIIDVFNESIDKNIVDFFKGKNKETIKDIEENDLVELIFQRNFQFITFKRIIDKLLIRSVDYLNNNAEYSKEVSAETVSIVSKEIKSLDILGMNTASFGDRGMDSIRERVNNSVSSITQELRKFEDFINYYNSKIIELNDELNSKDEEIKTLKDIVCDLKKELEEKRQAFVEVNKIKDTLKEIKYLLQNDDLL